MQCLDGSGQYFYCETTGSLIKDIFDFKSDAQQTDVSKHFGGLPAGGILGEDDLEARICRGVCEESGVRSPPTSVGNGKCMAKPTSRGQEICHDTSTE